MISFGELRRKSVEWRTEISTVEKIYARDWLLKGIFDDTVLRDALVLRGSSALASAYFADYPRVENIELARLAGPDDATLEHALGAAAANAAADSGLQFRVNQFHSTEAHIEFEGPLGRRSAAQPRIPVLLVATPPRIEQEIRPLVHPFSDPLQASVRAVALAELTAQRIVRFAQKPRALDVYELWFILKREPADTDRQPTLALAETIARRYKVTLRSTLNPAYAPTLELGWDKALKEIRNAPPFAQAQADISKRLREWQIE